MAAKPSTMLTRLWRLRTSFGENTTQEKLELLTALAAGRLDSAKQVERLHEILCFLRAYPDDEIVLRQVQSMLDAFSKRRDLAHHRRELEGSGIAGTAIYFGFFFVTAQWLAGRWPKRLSIDWSDKGVQTRLRGALPALVSTAEAASFRETRSSTRTLLEAMCGPDESDGACLVRHVTKLDADGTVREALHDGIDPQYRLAPGDRPSRTLAHHGVGTVAFQTEPLRRARPDLHATIAHPPRATRFVGEEEGAALIDLAREAMVTRARDLDAFAYGNAKDVSLTDDGDGLAFACIGSLPERRHLIRGAYGVLALKNGVPVGYIQLDVALGRAEVSFNIFETFRGAEAARLFVRTLAFTKHVLDCRSFSIEPYQLGLQNREAIDSGAWWFYYKLGFRPRQRALLRLATEELARMKREPGYRSNRTTLKTLSREHLHLELDRRRRPEPPPFLGVSRAVTKMISARFGGNRDEAERLCPGAALDALGVRSFGVRTPEQRSAVRRLSPVIVCLESLEQWTAEERRAVVDVVLAKGSPRESDFLERLAALPRLADAILQLAAANRVSPRGAKA